MVSMDKGADGRPLKLFNGTLDPNNHSNPKDDEYNYDDNASQLNYTQKI